MWKSFNINDFCNFQVQLLLYMQVHYNFNNFFFRYKSHGQKFGIMKMKVDFQVDYMMVNYVISCAVWSVYGLRIRNVNKQTSYSSSKLYKLFYVVLHLFE